MVAARVSIRISSSSSPAGLLYYGVPGSPEVDGQPHWIVNEGEYCMMNTLDLAVDQMFWELKWNPWVVRNLLDQFTRHYSYHDQVKLPAQEGNAAQAVAPGGISFCHDQGAHNQFSPFGQSSYELTDLTGCFSYMTQEELCNWVLLATSYVATTGDTQWAQQNAGTIRECMTSMMARREKEGDMLCCKFIQMRNRTGSPADAGHHLGQARSNTYMAVKCWAAYLGLGLIGYAAGDSDTAHLAGNEIEKLEWALAAIVRERKMLPAVYEKDSSALDSRILPAVEGLIYAMFWNNCPHIIEGERRKRLVSLDEVTPLEGALRQHLVTLLSDAARRNAFPEGGVRLSSTSDNSWLSKIAIVQHVARDLFNLDENGKGEADDAWLGKGRRGACEMADRRRFGLLGGFRPVRQRRGPRLAVLSPPHFRGGLVETIAPGRGHCGHGRLEVRKIAARAFRPERALPTGFSARNRRGMPSADSGTGFVNALYVDEPAGTHTSDGSATFRFFNAPAPGKKEPAKAPPRSPPLGAPL